MQINLGKMVIGTLVWVIATYIFTFLRATKKIGKAVGTVLLTVSWEASYLYALGLKGDWGFILFVGVWFFLLMFLPISYGLISMSKRIWDPWLRRKRRGSLSKTKKKGED